MEGTRGEGEALGLFDESTDDFGVAMALVDGRIGAQKVEVFVSLQTRITYISRN